MKANNICYSIGLLLAAACLINSCTSTVMTENELKKYVTNPEHGLIKEKELNGIKIQVTYRPTDLIIAQELRGKQPINYSTIDSLRKKFGKYLYFTLSISQYDNEVANAGIGSHALFGKKIEQLAFGMNPLVELTTDSGDKIPVADYIYPRMFGTTGKTSILFAFETDKISETNEVLFNLKDIGLGIGNNKFTFSLNEINNTPQLKI